MSPRIAGPSPQLFLVKKRQTSFSPAFDAVFRDTASSEPVRVSLSFPLSNIFLGVACGVLINGIFIALAYAAWHAIQFLLHLHHPA
jgi:hypothetical protein